MCAVNFCSRREVGGVRKRGSFVYDGSAARCLLRLDEGQQGNWRLASFPARVSKYREDWFHSQSVLPRRSGWQRGTVPSGLVILVICTMLMCFCLTECVNVCTYNVQQMNVVNVWQALTVCDEIAQSARYERRDDGHLSLVVNGVHIRQVSVIVFSTQITVSQSWYCWSSYFRIHFCRIYSEREYCVNTVEFFERACGNFSLRTGTWMWRVGRGTSPCRPLGAPSTFALTSSTWLSRFAFFHQKETYRAGAIEDPLMSENEICSSSVLCTC